MEPQDSTKSSGKIRVQEPTADPAKSSNALTKIATSTRCSKTIIWGAPKRSGQMKKLKMKQIWIWLQVCSPCARSKLKPKWSLRNKIDLTPTKRTNKSNKTKCRFKQKEMKISKGHQISRIWTILKINNRMRIKSHNWPMRPIVRPLWKRIRFSKASSSTTLSWTSRTPKSKYWPPRALMTLMTTAHP